MKSWVLRITIFFLRKFKKDDKIPAEGVARQSFTFPARVVLGLRPRCPTDGSAGLSPFPESADGTPEDSLLPQNLTASRRGRGTCTGSRTGKIGEGENERGLRGARRAHPAASHQLHI